MLYCILPNTIGRVKPISSFEYSMVIWFVTMYLIGGYFRHYGFTLIKHTTIALVLLIMSLFIMLGARTLQLYLGANYGGKIAELIKVFAEYNPNSIMSLVISILMFCVFLPIQFRGNKMFFSISNATFGVYLIHIIVRNAIWHIPFVISHGCVVELILTISLTFFFSLCIVWLISMLPFANYIIGYKQTSGKAYRDEL